MLAGERIGWDALSVPGLGQDEELGSRFCHRHCNDKIALARKADADHAACGASHRTRLALMEATDAPLARGENQIILSRGGDHLCKLIALIERDGDDSRRTNLFELLKRGLLHDAALG